jgi:hypothetical protein
MASGKKPEHWGRWVLGRAQVAGFRRHQDLARAVGCTRERITAWSAMSTPPARMRKGFDRALARALRITPFDLFTGYAHGEGGIDTAWDRWVQKSDEPLPWEFKGWKEAPAKEQLRRLAEVLDYDDLTKLITLGIALLKASKVDSEKAATAELEILGMNPDIVNAQRQWSAMKKEMPSPFVKKNSRRRRKG